MLEYLKQLLKHNKIIRNLKVEKKWIAVEILIQSKPRRKSKSNMKEAQKIENRYIDAIYKPIILIITLNIIGPNI